MVETRSKGKPSIIVLEQTAAISEAICAPLRGRGLELVRVTSRVEMAPKLERCALVVLGPTMVRAANVLELTQGIRKAAPSASLLVVAPEDSEDLAIAALRAGVNEYVKYTLLTAEMAAAVDRCVKSGHGEREGAGGIESTSIIGESQTMRDIKARVLRMAATNSNILITGETGTGKELVAEQMHQHSLRSRSPFVTLNCAAIPDSLVESELFGYERGAFTGAVSRQEGKIKAADGGSVFLDEIGEMSPYGQAKLLRVIEGKEIQRLGRNDGIAVNVRFIAATNQDLEEMVSEGKFRKDLFFRLNVARIHLPPLRERKEDLAFLVQHYIRTFNRTFGRRVEALCDEAMVMLNAHSWPGNVRELKNVIEAVFVELSPEEERFPHLPLLFRRHCAEAGSSLEGERDRVLGALSITNWNKSKAASRLHWSRMTLYRKMARYNITEC